MTFLRRLRNTWRELFGKPEREPDDFDSLKRTPRQGWAFLEDMGDWGETTRVQGRDER